MAPKEERAWAPKRAPVKEAAERTLRLEVVITLSPAVNLAEETEEELEDWEEKDWAELED